MQFNLLATELADSGLTLNARTGAVVDADNAEDPSLVLTFVSVDEEMARLEANTWYEPCDCPACQVANQSFAYDAWSPEHGMTLEELARDEAAIRRYDAAVARRSYAGSLEDFGYVDPRS